MGLSAVPIYNDNAPDKQGPAVVVEVLENTPAAKSGIRNGDFIVVINGADVAGKTAAEMLKTNLTGSLGGSVKVALWRDSEGRQFETELTRVPYPLRRNPASDPFAFYSPANWRPEVDQFPLPWLCIRLVAGGEAGDLSRAPSIRPSDILQGHQRRTRQDQKLQAGSRQSICKLDAGRTQGRCAVVSRRRYFL